MSDRYDLIERAAELAVLSGNERLLERVVQALGAALAERDPVTAAMLDLDERLRRRLQEQLAAEVELARIVVR